MRYNPIGNHIYKKNRDKFISKMKKDSIAVFNSNDIYPIGADSTFPFEQHRDIFYLTGIDQEETILLLSPQAQEIKNREILFIKNGSIRVDFYSKKKYLFSKVVSKNKILILLEGSHGFKILKNCSIIEVKQGPFSLSMDKERFNKIDEKYIKIKK